MSNKTLAILGATGSVGQQALDVARKRNYKVDAVSCNSDIKSIEAAV
ncbi:MAG: 1-deoxy-D-xylulose-5-phosphate reductoisomerase, partial [Clostridia bacterium]|nr:1-deoxy-D-xylulose-5-phosphate reductoisomerase [Clostridia bacterium]